WPPTKNSARSSATGARRARQAFLGRRLSQEPGRRTANCCVSRLAPVVVNRYLQGPQELLVLRSPLDFGQGSKLPNARASGPLFRLGFLRRLLVGRLFPLVEPDRGFQH